MLFVSFFHVLRIGSASVLIQLSDDPWYSALVMNIHIIDPFRTIVPHTICDAKPQQVVRWQVGMHFLGRESKEICLIHSIRNELTSRIDFTN